MPHSEWQLTQLPVAFTVHLKSYFYCHGRMNALSLYSRVCSSLSVAVHFLTVVASLASGNLGLVGPLGP